MHRPLPLRLIPAAGFAAVLLLGALSQLAAEDVLPGAQRILFLGDSITYDGKYVAYVETELLFRQPERMLTIINCGLPSETVSGLSEDGHAGGKFARPDLHERLDRVLSKLKPDLVFACYGMNDGIYLPLNEQRFQRFRDGVGRLRHSAESCSAKIILLTPALFDPAPIRARLLPADRVASGQMYQGYDRVLDQYSDWLLSQRVHGWQVIDVHGPMKQALADERQRDPLFTFSGDGVHPNPAGHRVMARALLHGLGLPPDSLAAGFAQYADPSSKRSRLFGLIHRRQRLLTDAWLTATGHQRPMSPGLPLDEAEEKAELLARQICEVAANP
jgi:lysophospholipase L1-like esterase